VVHQNPENKDKPPSSCLVEKTNNNCQKRKWRPWDERETLIKIEGESTPRGVSIRINSSLLNKDLCVEYPNSVWSKYPQENKVKLTDNLTYIFTAHLPFLLKNNVRMEYNTGYPHVYSWANACFMHFLPAYWYLYRGKRGTKVFPLLKTLLNSRAYFAETKDIPPRFPRTIDEQIIIPFSFGKDSFLTYHVAKEIGLKPTLVYFNEPTEIYSKEHKLKLIKKLYQDTKKKVYYLDNPFGSLRDYGEGWFGWELALTSWALLALPFAYRKKAGYIVFSNETSTNNFAYDEEGLKINPDFDQSAQATEELSIVTQALSEGEVYTTTFIQGLNELAIVGILKNRYAQKTFKYLMSCWAETVAAKHKRWCGQCTKCARLYVYLLANGVDPIKQAGFQDNMLSADKEELYNVFGKHAAGTGWDAFGLNTEEQSLAFYLCYLRKNKDPLIKKFAKTDTFLIVKNNFDQLIKKYYSLEEEHITPLQWKKKINQIFSLSLRDIRKEIEDLL